MAATDLGTLGILLLVVMFLLLGSGIWIAFTLAAVGYAALALTNPTPGLFLASAFWESTGSWTLAALPLFIWMGEILFRTRLSQELFNGLSPWFGRLPGRLFHVNIFACGIFGAVCGSSAATCATISKIALPELMRRGYDERLALGSLATSGTLGILIPPSIIMVVYGVSVETSIIRLFVAGLVPGLIVMALFSAYIVAWAMANPARMPPPEPRLSLGQKLRASAQLIPCVLLIIVVIGSMFAGFATATEAASVGVGGALLLAAVTRTLTWSNFLDSLTGATRLSCMIAIILAGAAFLTKAMALTGIPSALATAVTQMGLGPYALIAILTVVYVVLGCFVDGVSMIVLTTTIVVPLVTAAGFDLVWFGIFIVLLVEIAQVTPPVGFNLFVMQGLTGREQGMVARASLPFFLLLVLTVAIITVWPRIVTWLPDLLLNR